MRFVDKFGNTRHFTKADAAEMFARQNGTWQDQSRTLTETNTTQKPGLGGKTETTTETTTRKVLVGGYPKFVQKPKQNDPYEGLIKIYIKRLIVCQ